MAAAIALRSDFTGADLRHLARRTEDARQARRLLALAEIYDGGSRSDAARIGDVGLQIIRDWVLRFNADGPDVLTDRKAPGPEPRLTEAHRQALVAIIESGPIPAVHGVVRWRLIDLCQWLWEEFRVSVARQTLGRELRGLGQSRKGRTQFPSQCKPLPDAFRWRYRYLRRPVQASGSPLPSE